MRLGRFAIVSTAAIVAAVAACRGGGAMSLPEDSDRASGVDADADRHDLDRCSFVSSEPSDAGFASCDFSVDPSGCPSGSTCAFFPSQAVGTSRALLLGNCCVPLLDGSYDPCASGCKTKDGGCSELQSSPPVIQCP
jgi:hypothetical protein